MPVPVGDRDEDADLWEQIATEALRIEEAALQGRSSGALESSTASASRVSNELHEKRPSVRDQHHRHLISRESTEDRRSLRIPATNVTPHTPATVTGNPFTFAASVQLPSEEPAAALPNLQSGPTAQLYSEDWRSNDGVNGLDDAFSRVLREKDAQIVQIRYQKNGEITNLRHKLRALSSQFEAMSNAAVPEPSADAVKLHKLADEHSQMSKELLIAKEDVKRLSEKLSFAQQELASLQEIERKRVADYPILPDATKPLEDEFHADRHLDSSQANLLTDTRPDTSQALSQCVENSQTRLAANNLSTQQKGYEMSRGPRRPRRRRPLSSGDPASSGPCNGAVQSDFKECSRSNSPSQTLSRAIQSAEERPQSLKIDRRDGAYHGVALAANDKNSESETGNYPRIPYNAPCISVMWTELEMEQRDVDANFLREALFGCGRAEALFRMSKTMENLDLRHAISRVTASNNHWTDLLQALGGICGTCTDPEALIALNAICALVEHSKNCRKVLVLDQSYSHIVDCILGFLSAASDKLDPSKAIVALRIVSCLVSELSLEDKNNVTNEVRRKLEHESVLMWLQQEEKKMKQCCEVAAEVCADLILNVLGTSLAQDDEREGEFLEQTALCFATLLPSVRVSESVKTLALCALDWTSQVAPYFLDEKEARVLESICLYIVEVVHRMRMRIEWQRVSQNALCELLDEFGDDIPICWKPDNVSSSQDENYKVNVEQRSGFNDETDVAGVVLAVAIGRRLVQRGALGTAMASEITPVTRNVALNTLAFLGWSSCADAEGASVNDVRFPAAPLLYREKSLLNDARLLFHALIRSDPTA